MVMQSPDAVEQTSYVRVTEGVRLTESVTADGDYEISFGTAATLALTPGAAEELYRVLGTRIAELRRLAA
ncbi:hypothetical protein ACIGNX_03860 [Actinosynnema sp. NPDC053489]|uniref:hypothetical protein n=1 Tax=Actinosynnema sp. NPDC053489 TaxID=3363916 RepID=UPI0037CC2B23